MRDKLIELIQNAVDGCSSYWAGLIADHLIAHGVTIAENNNVLTNGDRIRSMSDEELAYWMTHLHEDGHCLNERCQIFQDKTCEECVIDWLKQPAKEDA